MKIYTAVPQELVDGWEQSLQTLSAGSVASFHYHNVEEWLAVVSGDITFFTLANEPFNIEVGRALRIPRGEVHRAEVGPDGVEYQMLLPVAVPVFVNELNATELDALRLNLEFPDVEDGRVEHGVKFFDSALSDKLVFCRADGTLVDKETLKEGPFVDKSRSSTGSIRVLNKTENGLLISTVVNMAAAGGVRSFTNVRFLAYEAGRLRCRLWVNYPRIVQGGEDGS